MKIDQILKYQFMKSSDFLSRKLQKVSLDYESFEKQLTNIIESFGNLMKTNSKYSIEGIQINIGITAQGNIIMAGVSMSGGMTITIKPKNNAENRE